MIAFLDENDDELESAQEVAVAAAKDNYNEASGHTDVINETKEKKTAHSSRNYR
jgi:hypothetical protein